MKKSKKKIILTALMILYIMLGFSIIWGAYNFINSINLINDPQERIKLWVNFYAMVVTVGGAFFILIFGKIYYFYD